MKPAPRWPLHPAPREGEALSSWLNRVALCYHMEESELLEHDLGQGQVDDMDTAPPQSLLAMLTQRSGIELDRLRCMSLAGWVPWLLDSLDDQIPDALETYAFKLSVLLPILRRPLSQNCCRLVRVTNPGAIVEERSGEIRTSLHGQSSSAVVAA